MKKWLKIAFWSAFTILVFVLLSLTKSAQMESELKVPNIDIKIKGENVFLTKADLLTRLMRAGFVYPGQKIDDFLIWIN